MAELNIASNSATRQSVAVDLAAHAGFSAFVGGPWDGRHMQIADDQNWLVARDEATGHEVRYYRHWLAGKDKRWSFFSLDGCDIDVAIGCLVHGYPGLAGFKDDNGQ